MDDKQVKSMLEETGLPVAYFCFDEDTPPSVPYLVFYMPESSHFYADGMPYIKKNKLYTELYVDHKDMELEAKLEEVLEKYKVSYKRQEAYIQEEKLFVEIYESEV